MVHTPIARLHDTYGNVAEELIFTFNHSAHLRWHLATQRYK
jgi:hypothetical protein